MGSNMSFHICFQLHDFSTEWARKLMIAKLYWFILQDNEDNICICKILCSFLNLYISDRNKSLYSTKKNFVLNWKKVHECVGCGAVRMLFDHWHIGIIGT